MNYESGFEVTGASLLLGRVATTARTIFGIKAADVYATLLKGI